jgi:D-beta-D-heptose 7-phosphate kinase/D-beta-D-heptose 1-phosphate adenosyltransferase
MTGIDIERMTRIVDGFKDKRVLVAGDLMLDKYIWGRVSRISPEAPIPVVEVTGETSCLGGSGNVGQNLRSLGAIAILAGVVGEDNEGNWIKKNSFDSRGIFAHEKRPTTVKTRIIAHHQQVVRVDVEEKKTISTHLKKKILKFIQEETWGGLIISDYNKGLLSESLIQNILSFAQQKRLPVFVDPKEKNFLCYSPVTLLTPNHLEAEGVVHHKCTSNQEIEKAGKKILSKISVKHLIIKRGEQGLSVFERGKRTVHIPAQAKQVYDVTGAGDTVIAVSSLALLAGASILEASQLANAAAGIVVGRLGTATLTPEELLSALRA